MISPARKWKLSVVAMGFVLSACGSSTTERDFLCPVVNGIAPCSTISDADRAGASQNTPVEERFADTLGKEMSQAPLGVGTGKTGPGTATPSIGDGGMAYAASQYRVPERVGTLWIAPYQDSEGLLHEATFVHFVVSEPRWAAGRP